MHGLTADGSYFVVRRGDGTVVHRDRVVRAPGGELVVNRGFLYAIGGDALVAIDPFTHQRLPVASALEAELFERPRIAVDEGCSLYIIRRSEIIRLSWETSRPTG